jgi:DNA repair ATPase RecN
MADAPKVDPGLRRRRRRRWVGRAGALIGIIVLVVALGIGVDANDHLRRTDATLDHTRGDLHHAMALLAAARIDLAKATAQNNAAGTTLAADTAALDSVQAQLAKAQANETEQGVNISDLDTCLSGVEQALNEISLSDQAGAATTLGRVADACTSAEPSS